MEIKNIRDAIAFDCEGILKYMPSDKERDFNLVIPVYKKIVEIKEGKRNADIYIHLWSDKEAVEKALLNKVILNKFGWKVRINLIGRDRYSNEESYLVKDASFVNKTNSKHFSLPFTTISRDFKFDNLPEANAVKMERYFTEVNSSNANYFLDLLLAPFEKIFKEYQREKYNVLKSNNLFHTQNIKGDREAEIRIKKDPQARIKYQESKEEVITAFNSYLTKEEKKTLMKWLNQHVNTLRLYVLKGGVYDELLSKEFPDEKYGVKRRTEPNNSEEGSVDCCGGYVGVDSLQDCPIELFQRIARKKDPKDVFKKSSSGNQYRFNSYGFVLYLLSEFNSIGYITGVSNLKNRIKMD